LPHNSLYVDSVISSNFQEVLDKVEVYRQSEAYLKAIRKRSLWVEPLFGEAKEFHNLRRFRLRRLRKVNIKGMMVAAGQNLKRLIQHYFAIFFAQNPLFVFNFPLFRTFSTAWFLVRQYVISAFTKTLLLALLVLINISKTITSENGDFHKLFLAIFSL
jgi:hypothetical protein